MRFEQIGPIVKSELELGSLTILCGGNNQGKTYISYAIYATLEELRATEYVPLKEEELVGLLEGSSKRITKEQFNQRLSIHMSNIISKSSKRILKTYFNLDEQRFLNAKIEISPEEVIRIFCLDDCNHYSNSITFRNHIFKIIMTDTDVEFMVMKLDGKEENLYIENDPDFIEMVFGLIVRHYINEKVHVMYFPAERTGINVFGKELNSIRAQELNSIRTQQEFKYSNLSKTSKNIEELSHMFAKTIVSYPKPIENYVDFINDINYNNLFQENSISTVIRDKMIGGEFKYDEAKQESYLKLKNNENISLHVASSSAKSLYGLDYYIDQTFEVEQSKVLFIDEPEINLHPKNQIKFAELLDQLVRANYKVIISTHSDFLMKKLINIVLKNNLYKDSNGINESNTKVYDVANGTISKIDYFNEDESYDNFESNFNLLTEEYIDLSNEIESQSQED